MLIVAAIGIAWIQKRGLLQYTFSFSWKEIAPYNLS